MLNRISKIFHYFLIGIILVSLGLHANYQVFYFVLYKVNGEDLTQSYCEKTRPDCNACCYLDKQFDLAENENQPADSNQRNNNKSFQEQVQKFLVLSFKDIEFIQRITDYHISEILKPALLLSEKIFHPPELIS